jgi:hypothetical protein
MQQGDVRVARALACCRRIRLATQDADKNVDTEYLPLSPRTLIKQQLFITVDEEDQLHA